MYLSQAKESSYKSRIVRLHQLYPKANLKQLSGHAKTKRSQLSKKKPISIRKRTWKTLKPKEAISRKKSLDVLSRMRRKGESLTKASKEVGTSPKTVKRHLGTTIKKVDNKYKASKYDFIPREMSIIEDGQRKYISVRSSKDARIIAKYNNAVKNFKYTGDTKYLKKFENVEIKDSNGEIHTLETNPDNLFETFEKDVMKSNQK